jgi:hypothetical protein
MTCCWECERATSRPITVTIGLPTGHIPRVQLCPPCYQTHYLPLIAELSIEGAHQVPPAPTHRTTGIRRTRS